MCSKSSRWSMWSVCIESTSSTDRHKRWICKGIKMLIKQTRCKSCFKPHEICMALCEPYAERIAHWHGTERNRDHFMLCWESVVLTPDTNAQPSPPCLKIQLINVASMNKKSWRYNPTLTDLNNWKACISSSHDLMFITRFFGRLLMRMLNLKCILCWF